SRYGQCYRDASVLRVAATPDEYSTMLAVDTPSAITSAHATREKRRRDRVRHREKLKSDAERAHRVQCLAPRGLGRVRTLRTTEKCLQAHHARSRKVLNLARAAPAPGAVHQGRGQYGVLRALHEIPTIRVRPERARERGWTVEQASGREYRLRQPPELRPLS